jgi:hypothetical protein
MNMRVAVRVGMNQLPMVTIMVSITDWTVSQ